MSGIDKFLHHLVQSQDAQSKDVQSEDDRLRSEQSKRPRGRPRKDPSLKHPRSKNLDKCGKDGRLLPEHVKRKKMAGRRSPASKRRTKRIASKRGYDKNRLFQKAYRDSLKRKFYQHRSVGRRYAQKKGFDPSEYYQLDYAQFILIWETAPLVYDAIQGRLRPAKELIDNPIKRKYDCTYLDRLDRTKPFTRENVRVFYRGKPLC